MQWRFSSLHNYVMKFSEQNRTFFGIAIEKLRIHVTVAASAATSASTFAAASTATSAASAAAAWKDKKPMAETRLKGEMPKKVGEGDEG